MIKLSLSSEELAELRQETIDVCTICRGTGNRFVYENNIRVPVNCSCVQTYSLYRRYVEAGIGNRYRGFNPENLTDDFMTVNADAYRQCKVHMDDMGAFIEQRKSLFMYGSNGVGKTAIGTYMVKQALAITKPSAVIEYKYRCGVFTLPEISSLLYATIHAEDKRDLLRRIYALDLIMIDEFDKEFKVSDKTNYFGLEFGEFFNNLYNSKKPIIIISNIPLRDIEEANIHAKDVIDRVAHIDETVVLRGDSFRQKI